MKFCGNCGRQLEDDDIFCSACGSKQDGFVETGIRHNDEVVVSENHQVETNAAPNYGVKNWLVVVLLIAAYPLILVQYSIGFFLIVPELLWWALFIGFQIVALGLMWSRDHWKKWVKFLVTVLYVLAYFI